MLSSVPTGSIETPYVQTEAVSTNAPSNQETMSAPTETINTTGMVVKPEDKFFDQAINQNI